MTQEVCPLCRKSRNHQKFRRLYGTHVCKKCYFSFANRRQLAYLLDWFFWWVTTVIFFSVIGFVWASNNPNQRTTSSSFETSITVLSWAIMPMFFLKDGFQGCSPGKAICGVRVIDAASFEPIGFWRSFKRNLPLIIPVVPFILAFTLKKGHRLGDKWANTKVVWAKYRQHPVFTNSLSCPQCQYNLRGNTTGHCPECGWQINDQTMYAIEREASPPPPETSEALDQAPILPPVSMPPM